MPEPAVGPFAQASLDEALGLAVGLWRVRTREGVLDAQRLAINTNGLGTTSWRWTAS